MKKKASYEFIGIVEMTESSVIKICYIDNLFLLGIHDWLGSHAVKWEWLTPLPALTNTAMVMAVGIF